jgi:hypothetical protein
MDPVWEVGTVTGTVHLGTHSQAPGYKGILFGVIGSQVQFTSPPVPRHLGTREYCLEL